MKRYILSKNPSDSLAARIADLAQLGDYVIIDQLADDKLKMGDHLVIAADLDSLGDNCQINQILTQYIGRRKNAFEGVKCAFCLSSESIYHTKDYAKRLAFVLNLHGARLNGHALFEVVEDYKNFKTWQKVYCMSLQEVCQQRLAAFHEAFIADKPIKRTKIVALHASERLKSNTLTLWEMVRARIDNQFHIQTLHIENGEIVDCKGCDFKTCLHFAEQNSCYYGGQVTKELLPAIEWADIVVWVCPNYNDAVSAMHTALINRLTVLYRKISLRDKQVYGIIVSANSGGDVVATQLIDALNFNKGFMLPPHAMLCETANDPATILKVMDIELKADQFAKTIMHNSQL